MRDGLHNGAAAFSKLALAPPQAWLARPRARRQPRYNRRAAWWEKRGDPLPKAQTPV